LPGSEVQIVPLLSAYQGLPFFDQELHALHFMLCVFAVLAACVPLLTRKGSLEHKFGGLIYLPLSLGALALASCIAWHEASVMLFCFNAFCAYLLLTGWRAAHEEETPHLIDWLIPGGLFALAAGVTVYVLIDDGTRTDLYLAMFAFNAYYLSWRDLRQLQRRVQWQKHKAFLGVLGMPFASDRFNRHIAGMVGSFMANLSVVVLTLLPLTLHWLWPVTLVLLAGGIAWRQRQKQAPVRKTVAAVLYPDFGAARAKRPLPFTLPGDEVKKKARR
jgi:hypothetical protein